MDFDVSRVATHPSSASDGGLRTKARTPVRAPQKEILAAPLQLQLCDDAGVPAGLRFSL